MDNRRRNCQWPQLQQRTSKLYILQGARYRVTPYKANSFVPLNSWSKKTDHIFFEPKTSQPLQFWHWQITYEQAILTNGLDNFVFFNETRILLHREWAYAVIPVIDQSLNPAIYLTLELPFLLKFVEVFDSVVHCNLWAKNIGGIPFLTQFLSDII